MSPGFLRRLNRVLWIGLVVAAAVAVAAYGALLVTVRYKEREIQRRWASGFSPMENFASRFAKTKKNSVADEIEKIAAPLGFPIIPLDSRNDLRHMEPGEWGAISNKCHRYLEAEFDRPDTVIEPIPPDVAAFLERHRDAASSVKNILVNEGPPFWDLDLAGREPRPPNHIGILSLGEWLCLDALSRLYSWDEAGAFQDLEATWILEQGIRARPELVYFETAAAVAKDRLGVLIKSEMAPPRWVARLQFEPYQRDMKATLQFEAWRYWNAGRMMAGASYTGRAARREGWLWKIFGRLWFRLSMAEANAACLDQIEILEKQGWCNSSLAADADRISTAFPRWSAIGGFGVTRMSLAWTSMEQLALELEFTRKLFVARDARCSLGKWPSEIPSIEKSNCPGTRWNYGVDGTGGMTLSYSGSTARPKRAGRIDLPLVVKDGGLVQCTETSQPEPVALYHP